MKYLKFGFWFFLTLIVILFGVVIFGYAFYKIGKPNKNSITNCIPDTVFVDKIVYKEKPEEQFIPVTYSKFHKTDCIKAWGKWAGVITNVKYAKDKKTVVYICNMLTTDGSFMEEEYYDTELEIGECK
jgi:hypothetical protein